jgi:hypothetical protein
MDSGNPVRFPGTRDEYQPSFGGRPINANTNRKEERCRDVNECGGFVFAVEVVSEVLGVEQFRPEDEVDDRSLMQFGSVNTTILLRLASYTQRSTRRSRL